MKTKAPKAKRCKAPNCGSLFVPARPLAAACSPLCALEIARQVREKKARQEALAEKRADKVKREKQKTRADWLKEAQAEFNQWVRLRDADRPCISCDRHHQGQYHAGHYLSVGARPEMRFFELNVWKQCSVCNNHRSGNAILFRQALVRELGLAQVDWLEGPHPPLKLTIEEIQAIKTKYAALARQLRKERE